MLRLIAVITASAATLAGGTLPVSITTIGYGRAKCRVMVTRYRGHLVVEALSGNENGRVRLHGTPKRIY